MSKIWRVELVSLLSLLTWIIGAITVCRPERVPWPFFVLPFLTWILAEIYRLKQNRVWLKDFEECVLFIAPYLAGIPLLRYMGGSLVIAITLIGVTLGIIFYIFIYNLSNYIRSKLAEGFLLATIGSYMGVWLSSMVIGVNDFTWILPAIALLAWLWVLHEKEKTNP